jgi:putative copper resistance protein D
VFDELVAVRAIHFASTAMVAGGVMFRTFVGEPSFRHEAACLRPGAQAHRRQVNRMVWMSLAVSVASGTLWLLLLAKDIEQQSWQDLFSDDTVFVVLTATQFGRVWMARFAVALLLCLALLFGGTRGTPDGHR